MKIKIEDVVKDLASLCIRYRVVDNENTPVTEVTDLKIENPMGFTIDDIKKLLIEQALKFEKSQSHLDELKKLEGSYIYLDIKEVDGKTQETILTAKG